MSNNKMIIHYCGGAGLNIARFLSDKGLNNQGEGFCNIESKYLDTSGNNIADLPKESFWKVMTTNFNPNQIDGSGGLV